ncbi:uncharacterized protein LOC106088003 [Stomoxys calcitrans]|uniref:uncharacterized protein LOC106088003 n=1 Tax=Stomoxys calcitrans TaxID=35570 RepID=UPI0027E2F846|nr:uncharacterized protein LOC106088003 [Stomoxys calcitrans]
MTFYTSNTDILEVEYEVKRISRGRYGFSGFLDFKTDLDDSVLVDVSLKRSQRREGPYRDTSMKAPNVTLSTAMNVYYKLMIMDTVAECCENAPVFKKRFEAPLTKRRVIINECEMSQDGMPLIMPDGFYLLRTSFFGDNFHAYLDTLILITNE